MISKASAQWERPRLVSPPQVLIIHRPAGKFGERSKLIIMVGGGHPKPDYRSDLIRSLHSSRLQQTGNTGRGMYSRYSGNLLENSSFTLQGNVVMLLSNKLGCFPIKMKGLCQPASLSAIPKLHWDEALFRVVALPWE